MENRVLGRTKLSVSAIGMGTWQTFDVKTAVEISDRKLVIDKAFERGVNFYDSSPMYRNAEKVLALTLDNRRRKCLIATKVWAIDVEDGKKQIKKSLNYFEDYIDLLQIHNLWSWKYYLTILEALKSEGKIASIGATHYNPNYFADLKKIILTKKIDAIQVPYNPLEREIEKEILPLASDNGLGVIIMRPFSEGLLLKNQPPKEKLIPLQKFGVFTWSQALLKWILSNPNCHTVIPATSSTLHMAENTAAGKSPWFSEAERSYIIRLAIQYN